VNASLTSRVHGLLTGSAGKAVITLADQGVVSVTNFLAAVLVGRFAGKEELGLYYLGFQGILVFAQNTQMSLVSAAYIVYGPRQAGEEFRRYTGSTLIHSLAIGLLAALGLAVAGLWMRFTGLSDDLAGLDAVVLVLAGVTAFFLLREYARQVCFARLNAHAALLVDGAVLVVEVGGILALGWLGRLTAAGALGLIGLSCGLSALGWLVSRRAIFAPELRRAWPDFRRNWAYSRWIFAMNLAFLGSMQIYPWLLTLFHGKAANGVLGACGTVIFLSNPLLIGLGNFLGPKCVHAHAGDGIAGMARVVRKATLFFLVTMGAFCVMMFAGGGWLLRLLFGEEFAGYGPIIGVWALAQLAWSIRIPAEYGMNALERPDIGFKSLMLMLLVTLTGGVWLTWRFGPAGVVTGIALGQAAARAFSRFMFQRIAAAEAAREAEDTQLGGEKHHEPD
jgi:O-antigen/teichoic acid export membrane protein